MPPVISQKCCLRTFNVLWLNYITSTYLNSYNRVQVLPPALNTCMPCQVYADLSFQPQKNEAEVKYYFKHLTMTEVNHIISSLAAITYLILFPQHLSLPGEETPCMSMPQSHLCAPSLCFQILAQLHTGRVAPTEGEVERGRWWFRSFSAGRVSKKSVLMVT